MMAITFCKVFRKKQNLLWRIKTLHEIFIKKIWDSINVDVGQEDDKVQI